MKKTLVSMIMLLLLFSGLSQKSYAMSDAQAEAIQALLDDASRISGVPGLSISILEDEKEYYYSSGYADLEKGILANENTLYELASVSKAFTGLGILLLEEQGLLSMTDSIHDYLPWLTLKYQGKPVNMQSLTLNNFLHHTSGLTTNKHSQLIPQGNTPDMLQKTVEVLVDADLSFPSGKQHTYGTINYDVLGLVIEQVSGQSYESFMNEQVFQPLGLNQTFVYKEDAMATGELAQGYRSSFFKTTPYNAPDYSGNKPAGYIISSTKDMARWMGIQMGIVKDIPDIFHTTIQKSHQGDRSVRAVDSMYYAAGWMVDTDQTIIEHPGENPSFRTHVVLLPNERTAICLLANGANINNSIVLKIKDIVDGNLSQTYEISSAQLLDILMSIATITCCLLTVIFFVLGFRRRKLNKKQPITKKRKIASFILLLVTVALSITSFALEWSIILVWETYSILTALISVTLLTASLAWLVYSGRYSRPLRYLLRLDGIKEGPNV